MYVGDGQMIEAPNSRSEVRIVPVRTSDFRGARRFSVSAPPAERLSVRDDRPALARHMASRLGGDAPTHVLMLVACARRRRMRLGASSRRGSRGAARVGVVAWMMRARAQATDWDHAHVSLLVALDVRCDAALDRLAQRSELAHAAYAQSLTPEQLRELLDAVVERPDQREAQPALPITSCATRCTSSAVTASRPASSSSGSIARALEHLAAQAEQDQPVRALGLQHEPALRERARLLELVAGTARRRAAGTRSAITSTASSTRFRSTPACAKSVPASVYELLSA